jgi:hypothetical protein
MDQISIAFNVLLESGFEEIEVLLRAYTHVKNSHQHVFD